jgi:hypothetical protein
MVILKYACAGSIAFIGTALIILIVWSTGMLVDLLLDCAERAWNGNSDED